MSHQRPALLLLCSATSATPLALYVLGIFKIGPVELFAQDGFELQSS
jgi:hypothetical protein